MAVPMPPPIILPDATPLIHLAAGEALDVLTATGRVIIPEVVAMKATDRPDKPLAPEIAAWLARSTGTNPDAPVRIVETETGILYRMVVQGGGRPPRHAGELSIMEWMRDNLDGHGPQALVVYEDRRFPRMMAQEERAATIVAVTTLAFLELANDGGMIPSAEDIWAATTAIKPTASPVSRHRTFGRQL